MSENIKYETSLRTHPDDFIDLDVMLHFFNTNKQSD